MFEALIGIIVVFTLVSLSTVLGPLVSAKVGFVIEEWEVRHRQKIEVLKDLEDGWK